MFEPSGIGDPKLFREAWSLSHVIKYSHERLRDIADLELRQSDHAGVLLEIETLGADGLRYRSRLPKVAVKGWPQVSALKPLAFKDAAGAGDWCTAGILSRLARGGLTGFRRTSSEKLQDALRFGQALAAWNCGFEGARGGVYHVDRRTFKRQVEVILSGTETAPAASTAVEPVVVEFRSHHVLPVSRPTLRRPGERGSTEGHCMANSTSELRGRIHPTTNQSRFSNRMRTTNLRQQ